MKKTAFTMIELVFVIVILGILAAVAVPKLTASRADAAATAALAKYKMTVNDIKSTALANNAMETKLIDMTTATNDVLQGDTTATTNGVSVNGIFIQSNGKKCLKIEPNGSTGFTITYGDDISEIECALIGADFSSPSTITLLGQGVQR